MEMGGYLGDGLDIRVEATTGAGRLHSVWWRGKQSSHITFVLYAS
jgi:hypothetical protein